MTRSIRLTYQTTICLLAMCLVAPVAAGSAKFQPNDRQRAEALWELAITAKGGRQRLHKVESLAISYEETTKNILGVVVHRGHVEHLYVFPGKAWIWDDGLPPPFRLTVIMINLERDQRCVVRQGSDSPRCSQAKQPGASQANDLISQAQFVYLMETAWVTPVPYSVTKDKLGGRSVDVLHTRFADQRIDYYLDAKTHLAMRVAVFHGNRDSSGVKFDFSHYESLGGIQMPRKQKNGEIAFELNPMFGEEIFKGPPVIGRGPKAWRKLEN